MNIKSLLLGSAAALAVVSGAQAADAIVAAEPEPMEYVRVCDAFGTGFFYIPGTETCLKIGGEVRVTINFDESDDWESAVRSRVFFDAKNDTEIGTVGSYIRLTADNFGTVEVVDGYITVGGFKVGVTTTFWDDVGVAGEVDDFADLTGFRMANYTYATDAFTVGVGIDDLTGVDSNDAGTAADYAGNQVGVQGMASATLGAATVSLYGVYDFGAEEGAVYGKVAAAIGPGTLELGAGWSSGDNVYVGSAFGADIEWTLAAGYAVKATEKLTITPAVSFWELDTGDDVWGAGLLAEYQLATGLTASASVEYKDADNLGDDWDGFVRLTRSF